MPKTNAALKFENPNSNWMKMGKIEQKTGATAWPHENYRQAPARDKSTARRHRLAEKQAKMATARRYKTGSHGSGKQRGTDSIRAK